jgi:hypothetical protein
MGMVKSGNLLGRRRRVGCLLPSASFGKKVDRTASHGRARLASTGRCERGQFLPKLGRNGRHEHWQPMNRTMPHTAFSYQSLEKHSRIDGGHRCFRRRDRARPAPRLNGLLGRGGYKYFLPILGRKEGNEHRQPTIGANVGPTKAWSPPCPIFIPPSGSRFLENNSRKMVDEIRRRLDRARLASLNHSCKAAGAAPAIR